ncbi:MAG TPA: hypothetical protein VHP36_08680 [Chitinispirillaceae bacterium]|nr:hypothetical protein [Chitinispirillaceae bacterium]
MKSKFHSKSAIVTIVTFIVMSSGNVAAEVNANPYSMGMGNVCVYSGGIDAAVNNPAFLGAQLKPWGGIAFSTIAFFCCRLLERQTCLDSI